MQRVSTMRTARVDRVASRRQQELVANTITHILLIVLGLAALAPFWWMIATSFKTEFEAFQIPPTWLPLEPTLEAYGDLFLDQPFGIFLYNSVKIAVLSVGGQLITSSLAAFAFARLDFPGKNVLFIIVLSTMMVPYAVTVIPLYIVMHRIGWVNTHLPLIVPAMLSSAYGTFLLRQFMFSLPVELEDAARIDGCSSFGIYRRIALPLMKPALATLGVFSFMASWNNFFGPFIFLDRKYLFTVQLGVALVQRQWYTSWPRLMAGSVVVTLPVLLVFLLLQRYFVRGISLTGIKG
ncbi:MAG: carbohydrate ABC transporter permease [Caldilineaceae bacterium]|nr:carbohydrate ABC transporter permease [Caldilineaceae bacterium]